MAKALYLLQRSLNGGILGMSHVDDIHMAVGNFDDGLTTAQIITQATDALKAAGHKLPDNYFVSATQISNLTSGPLADDGDMYYNTKDFHVNKLEG